MTPQEAKKMLKAKLECLKRETSGTDIDCNYRNCDECNLCYEQGNMGEQKEALDMAIKALEQEPKTGHWEWVQYDSNPNIGNWHCSECRTIIPHMPVETDRTPIYKWCPMCGAKMAESEDKGGKR